MKINDIPSDIGNYLEYDESSSTGLRWKKLFSTHCRRINVGDVAGWLDKNIGYYRIKFNNNVYLNHRIVYFLHYGVCPNCIDHIDNNPKNNNINNLREATLSENQYNSTIPKNNKTGVKGLSIKKDQYWYLQIRKNCKHVFCERYKLSEKTKDECRIILENKRKELHGLFSNHG